LTVLAAAVALLGVAVSVSVAKTTSSSSQPPLRRAELLAYEDRLLPLVQDGGRVVEQGMKPAMDDLRNQHIVPARVIAQEGDGWVASLTSVRSKVQALPAPHAVSPAQRAFLQALDEYVVAARAFRAAAQTAPGAARNARIDEGVRHAEQADATYDRGAAILQRLRRSLGLRADPNFPEVSGG
jgi:hypothetical protein